MRRPDSGVFVVQNDSALNERAKYLMRFNEFKMIKPKPPLTPAQARLSALKNNIASGRKQLKAERDLQAQQRERDAARKLQIGLKPFGKASLPSALR